MSEITIYINGKECKSTAGRLILEIAKENGIEIPSLCYDERVKPYGSCGVCLVEAEGMPRLIRACSTIATDGMKLHTESERAKKNRKAALELLLSVHDGDCRPPCANACPAETDCQGYAQLIALGKYDEAVKLIKEKLPLPASIGRVCPHPCEDKCRRDLIEEPVSLAFLKYFAADKELDNPYIPETAESTGKKVAIAGGGPGGLTAAYYLRIAGHDVTVYDALPKMGGMLRYGIPEYRLPKEILDKEIKIIADMGAALKNNVKLGKDIQLDELRKDYDAVLLAVGAWKSSPMRCEGEDMQGVYGGIDFLLDVAQGGKMIADEMFKNKNVAIVGGGNVAMDCCRTLIRLGAANVYNIYRRTRNEMPAEEIEIIEAEEEGVIFKNLTNPNAIIGENGVVKQVRLQIMELGEPDASGRRAPVPVEGKEEILDVDAVFAAIGQKTVPQGLEGIELTKWGTIIADENSFRTNLDAVFAVGDAVNDGAGIAITAIGQAGKAATAIDAFLKGETIEYKKPVLVERDVTEEHYLAYEKIARAKMPHMSPTDRRTNFEQVNFGFSDETAQKEASRCLDCGCQDYYNCKLIKYAAESDANPAKYGGAKHVRGQDERHSSIILNPDKCVLCGLCMRVCEEIEDKTALGLAGRGFDTVMLPAVGRSLADTACNDCGKCAEACPTGAVMKKTDKYYN
jgi:formate dehydrogenase major subunit